MVFPGREKFGANWRGHQTAGHSEGGRLPDGMRWQAPGNRCAVPRAGGTSPPARRTMPGLPLTSP